jgi:hypothetical protein
MATTLYDKGRQRFLEAAINWLTDTIKVVAVDTATYTFSQAHEFFSEVPAGSRVSASVALSGKTTAGGAADANDVTFPAVSGSSIEALIFYKDGGTEATSPLIGFFDTGTGLPITPNSGDIIVQWDNGASKIFKL